MYKPRKRCGRRSVQFAPSTRNRCYQTPGDDATRSIRRSVARPLGLCDITRSSRSNRIRPRLGGDAARHGRANSARAYDE